MRLFNKVAIIGTGLIGGSLALAIKKNKLASQVVGVSRRKNTLSWAKRIGAIDRGSQDFSIVKGSDLVIFAMPVGKIIELAPKIKPFIDSACLVTDVGSTKKNIVKRFEGMSLDFIGAHPMAGSEKRGIVNASAGLFKDSLCVLTPSRKSSHRALDKVNKFWKALGARTTIITPENHDRALAFTSHLAHAASFALIKAVPQQFFKLSASGLKDTTRIASSDPRLWADVFLTNRENTVAAIETLERNLRQIKSAIKRQDAVALESLIRKAKNKRDALR